MLLSNDDIVLALETARAVMRDEHASDHAKLTAAKLVLTYSKTRAPARRSALEEAIAACSEPPDEDADA